MMRVYVLRHGFERKFFKEQEGLKIIRAFVLKKDIIKEYQVQAQLASSSEYFMFCNNFSEGNKAWKGYATRFYFNKHIYNPIQQHIFSSLY